MGLPNISITFKTTAAAAIARSEKGVVGLILRDSTTALQNKGFVIHSASDIPSTLAADNAAYIKRALIGYVNPPRKVVAYVLATLRRRAISIISAAPRTAPAPRPRRLRPG